MATQRTDASSLSFGRRLLNAERDAAQAKQELAQLKEALPNNQALQAAALTGDVIKQQRKLAKQAIARADVTADELNSIDPGILTPAFQEQLRLRKRDVLMAQEMQPQSILPMASPAALQRIENFRNQPRLNNQQQTGFAANNLWPEAPSSFSRWDARQRSIAGRQWNDQLNRAQYDRDVMQAKARWQEANKTQPKGRHIGNVKPLEDS